MNKNLTAALLSSMIEEPIETITTAKVSAKPRLSMSTSMRPTDMTEEDFKAYKAERQRERRQRIRNKAEAGTVEFNADTAREALADAALMILAADGDGSGAIRSYLHKVFHDQPGALMTLEDKVKRGYIKPRLLPIISK